MTYTFTLVDGFSTYFGLVCDSELLHTSHPPGDEGFLTFIYMQYNHHINENVVKITLQNNVLTWISCKNYRFHTCSNFMCFPFLFFESEVWFESNSFIYNFHWDCVYSILYVFLIIFFARTRFHLVKLYFETSKKLWVGFIRVMFHKKFD